VTRGFDQRRERQFVGSVGEGAGIEQHLHRGKVPFPRRAVKGRAQVAAQVDVEAGVDQVPDHPVVPAVRRQVQQRLPEAVDFEKEARIL
jgi:hypothetical protein